MEIHEDRKISGREVKRLGLVTAKEVALHEDVAYRVARQRLEKKASDKEADAIIGFHLESQRVLNGVECAVTGIAVKFIDA